MWASQAYPAMVTSGSDADVMAANELATHIALQVSIMFCTFENCKKRVMF